MSGQNWTFVIPHFAYIYCNPNLCSKLWNKSNCDLISDCMQYSKIGNKKHHSLENAYLQGNLWTNASQAWTPSIGNDSRQSDFPPTHLRKLWWIPFMSCQHFKEIFTYAIADQQKVESYFLPLHFMRWLIQLLRPDEITSSRFIRYRELQLHR